MPVMSFRRQVELLSWLPLRVELPTRSLNLKQVAISLLSSVISKKYLASTLPVSNSKQQPAYLGSCHLDLALVAAAGSLAAKLVAGTATWQCQLCRQRRLSGAADLVYSFSVPPESCHVVVAAAAAASVDSYSGGG